MDGIRSKRLASTIHLRLWEVVTTKTRGAVGLDSRRAIDIDDVDRRVIEWARAVQLGC